MGSRGPKLKAKKIPEALCYACLRPTVARMLCKGCTTSFDRAMTRAGSNQAWVIIVWAANRARKFMLKDWQRESAALRAQVEHYKRFAP